MNKYPLKKNEILKLLKKISIDNLGNEIINLNNGLGRFVSCDIFSNINIPPYDNSAVDGYAIHDKNLKNTKKLKCVYRIPAGNKSFIKLKEGEAARIFTGAKMPLNSNTVLMQENANIEANDYISFKKIPQKGENRRMAGEDILKGTKILKKGDKIKFNNFNLLAAVGKRKVTVKNKLKVGYFTCGNELVEPSEKLKDSQINNSNRYSLQSLLNHNFIKSQYLGNLKDSLKKISTSINSNLKNFDIIITTGGASVGEEDHLIDFLKTNGKIFFWKTAIKPGRPLAIGKIKKTIIICFPGNPVSVHLLHGMIIKPFLEFLSGSKFILPKRHKAVVNFSMKKKTERLEWIRVVIENNFDAEIKVKKYPKQGSGMISSLAFSDGIIEIPEKISQINKGDKFDFFLFRDLFN